MRKSKVEQFREAKQKRHQVTVLDNLDDLLRLLVDPRRDAGERRLNPTQKAFIYSPARFKAYKGPAGCAKTSTLCAAGLVRALLQPGSKGLVARQDYNDLVDTTKLRLEEMLAVLPKGTLLDRDKSPPEKWYLRPAAITLPDGTTPDEPSQITFMGLKEQPGGYEFNWAIVDEADEVEESRIHWIDSRLRHRGGNRAIMLAFNPPPTTHWLYKACTGLDPTNRRVQDPWFDLFEPRPDENTRNLPDGYYEQLAAHLPSDMRRRLVDGLWGTNFAGAPVFGQFRRELHVRRDLRYEGGTLYRFWDFGYNHPACLWAQVSYEGHVQILRERLGSKMEATAFAQLVKKITAETFPTAERILDYGDVSAKQHKDTGSTLYALAKEGIQLRMQRMGIEESLRRVRKLMETLIIGQPAFVVDQSCQILIDGLSGGYALRDDGVTPIKDGLYDHLVDAMRYGIVNVLGLEPTVDSEIPSSLAYDPRRDEINERR